MAMGREHGAAHILLAGLVTGVSAATTAVVGVTQGTDLAGIALIIVAVGSLITAIGGVVVAVMVNRVHREVKTINSMTIGQQTDSATVARFEAIPHDDRTKAEQSHIDAAPDLDPPQGPPR